MAPRSLTATNCTLSGNMAIGGIYTQRGIINGKGDGGGLYVGGNVYARSTATLTGCTISGNSASADGGGLVRAAHRM